MSIELCSILCDSTLPNDAEDTHAYVDHDENNN